MLTNLTLATLATLLLPVEAQKQPPTAPPDKVNAILCQTEAQAISLASSMAVGKTEPIAVNLVNKASGAEVCGRYIGHAVVEI
jgi:hypothetical protein